MEKGEASHHEESMKPAAAAAADFIVTVDPAALNCPVCSAPLKPPVFQCSAAGHVVCSSCHGKLLHKDRCEGCAMATGYSRCFAIERILRSARAPCSNSKYGCTAQTAYYGDNEHEMACPYARCFCPEAGCGFAGSTAELLCHLTAVDGEHKWPSTELKKYGTQLTLPVQDGVRVLHGTDGRLFLVKFTPAAPLGHATSVVCVEPRAIEPKFRCHIDFRCHGMSWKQSCDFQITSSSLSSGLPTESCVFVVPSASGLATSVAVTIADLHPPAKAKQNQVKKKKNKKLPKHTKKNDNVQTKAVPGKKLLARQRQWELQRQQPSTPTQLGSGVK